MNISVPTVFVSVVAAGVIGGGATLLDNDKAVAVNQIEITNLKEDVREVKATVIRIEQKLDERD